MSTIADEPRLARSALTSAGACAPFNARSAGAVVPDALTSRLSKKPFCSREVGDFVAGDDGTERSLATGVVLALPLGKALSVSPATADAAKTEIAPRRINEVGDDT